MIEPISLIATIIGIIASALVIAVMSVTLIKNGSEIVGKIDDFIDRKLNSLITFTKSDSMGQFIGMCIVFNEYQSKIKCTEWKSVTISDSNGQNKIFMLPSPGKSIELELDNGKKIIVKILGTLDVIGFTIYYKKSKHIIKFIENGFKKVLSKSELQSFIEIIKLNGPNTKHNKNSTKRVTKLE